MERWVFSDPAIAALMHRDSINIKVDREERPDLDEIFMTTTRLLIGPGGWPNSVFLTLELEPFFAGTVPLGVALDTVVAKNLVTVEMTLAPEVGTLDGRRFELRLSIRDGWHINPNPVSLKSVISRRIEGAVRAVEYPRETPLRPVFVGAEIQVDSGQVAIPGEVSMRQPWLRLTFQACDDRRCLPPVTRESARPGAWHRSRNASARPARNSPDRGFTG